MNKINLLKSYYLSAVTNFCVKSNYKFFYFLIFFLPIFLNFKYSLGNQDNLDSLFHELNMSKRDSNMVLTLYKISTSYYLSHTNPDSAFLYAQKGLNISDEISFTRGRNLCLNALGNAFDQRGDFNSAMKCYEERFEIVSKLKDSIGIAESLDNISTINYRWGNNEKAIEQREKANAIYLRYNEPKSLALGYYWLGSIYQSLSDYEKALQLFMKALKTFEDLSDFTNIGYCNVNISSIYRNLKQYDSAIEFINKGKESFEKVNFKYGVGVSLYRKAIVYDRQGLYDLALKNTIEASKIFEEIKESYFLKLSYFQIGSYYSNMNENEKALEYFEKALKDAEYLNEKSFSAAVFQNIGKVYQKKEKYDKALYYYYASDSLLNQINDKRSLIELSENFIEIYSLISKPDSVKKYFLRHRDLSDSIFNEQMSASIADLKIKYETERKDKEIIELKLENEKRNNYLSLLQKGKEISELKIQNMIIADEKKAKDLQLINAEKDKQKTTIELLTLKEQEQRKKIDDERIKKNKLLMTFIISTSLLIILSTLVIHYLKTRKSKEQAILNRQIVENSIKALRAQMNPHFIFNCVHTIELLLNDLKIEESKNSLYKFSSLTRKVLENSQKKEIFLLEEIEILELYMSLENLRFKNPFKYNISIKNEIDPTTTLIVPLILQPFVENSIKHGLSGFGKTGNINIEFKDSDNFLICTIEDNGIGINNNVKIKNTYNPKKESLGLKLTEERLKILSDMKKINCRYTIEDLRNTNNNSSGTKVKVYLPYEVLS